MNKLLLTCLILVVLCSTTAKIARATSIATVSINPAIVSIAETEIGQTFEVKINVTDVTDLWSWKVRLNWDPTVINFTGVQEGPFLQNIGSTIFLWGENWTAVGEGYIPEISCTLFTGSASGSGVLATVTFKSVAPGLTEISMNETEMHEPSASHPSIPHSVLNGEVHVIPEFNSWIILPLAAASSALVILAKKKYHA
jgi:hypothetical protein